MIANTLSAMLPAEQHSSAIRSFLDERSRDETRLRLATEADAAFLLGLRLDSSLNKNISHTSSDLAEQRAWMRSYEARHAAGREAYFVIEVAGVPEGSIRLYDYLPKSDSFCWGSWIIRPGAPMATAFQSVMIVYDLGFGPLGFARAHFDVRQANISVWKFHEKMGVTMVREDAADRFYEYPAENYKIARTWLKKFTQMRDTR